MDYEERQFEQNLTPEERELNAMLSQAFTPSNAPEDFISRIAAGSVSNLPVDIQGALDVALEQKLDRAFSVHTPDDLTNRVFAASVNELGGQPVIATINKSVIWRQVALAACVVFAVFVALRFSSTKNDLQPLQVATNEVLSTEEENLLLADLNLSEYAYLADTRELAFADVAMDVNMLRDDLELWQYGLLQD